MSDTSSDNDLAFYTTQQLINEIFSRKTFVGVLIAATDENRVINQSYSDFCITTTIEENQVLDLLEKICSKINRPA
jgi:hypothetical protein